MAFLPRVFPDRPPRLRTSEKADIILNGEDTYRVVFRSRAVLASRGRTVGPAFETDAQAQKFADWCNGKVRKFN